MKRTKAPLNMLPFPLSTHLHRSRENVSLSCSTHLISCELLSTNEILTALNITTNGRHIYRKINILYHASYIWFYWKNPFINQEYNCQLPLKKKLYFFSMKTETESFCEWMNDSFIRNIVKWPQICFHSEYYYPYLNSLLHNDEWGSI